MVIGIPKEIKQQENRVSGVPAAVMGFTNAGHTVYVEKNAGLGSGFTDEEYVIAGAKILDSPERVFSSADMILKVKEPLESEYGLLREGQILFSYLHLAPDPKLTKALQKANVVGIAYETIQTADGRLPLLAPMSEIAGRLSIQVGAYLLQKANNGRGILLGGVPGVEPGHVVIIGGGVVGINAAKMAVGLGARVTILNSSVKRLAYIDDLFANRVVTLVSNPYNIAESVARADLVVGAVLIPGAKTPKLVTEKMVMNMRPGSAIVDVSIDQGGAFETMDRTTYHDDPCFIKHGVVHYSVANMPSAVSRTSTAALSNAVAPYALQLANYGAEAALVKNAALMKGLNIYKGKITCQAVAEAQGVLYEPAGLN